MNDVRVVSLSMTSVLIADIAMDVPSGVTLTIPAEKAAKSKDLWRLLGQKQLFRLNPGPFQDFPAPTPPSNAEAERLREENRLLAEENRLQAEQNRLLRTMIESQGGKLDKLLGFLEQGGRIATTASGSPQAEARPTSDVVDEGVPTYIPSQIKPEGVESHVEVQSETSEGSGVSGAQEALRKLRKGAR